MGAAINAVGDILTLLRHNPIILVVGGAATVVYSIINFVLGLIPIIGSLLALLLYPVFVAGLLGIIYAGRDGTAGVKDFLGGINHGGLQMILAYTLITVPMIVMSILLTLLAIFVVPAAGQGLGSPTAAGGSLMLLYVGFGLVVALGWMFIQFFNVAIVAGDGVMGSFKTSIAMVIDAPLSTLGFMLLKFVLGAVFLGIPYVVIAFAVLGGIQMEPSVSAFAGISAILGIAVYGLILAPLWRVIARTYHVAYFNRRQAQLP